MPYNGIVDSTRLKKWLEPNNVNEDLLVDSEGNTNDAWVDYEY